MDGKNLLIKYPSLEVMYEHIKDTLQNETQALSDLSVKATFLWGAITTILGIAIPIVHQVGKVDLNSPLLIWVLVLYALTTFMSFWIIFPNPWHDTIDFDDFWDEFAERTKEVFWYDMFTYIAKASKENQSRLSRDAWLIRIILLFAPSQFALVMMWILTSVVIS